MSDQPQGPWQDALAPGSLIGSYQIEGVAGRGGMGVVYRAIQQRPRRMVALKVISPQLAADQEFRQRFEREAELAASIEHPNVIPIYEAGDYNGLLFLAMRYIEGTDLREWLTQHGPMPPVKAARIIGQVGDALDAAHAAGLVHRDVKPGNMLLSERGGRDHVYLTDFGLTKQSGSTAAFTKTGTWVGTVDYVAPEQVRGERVDARADVYSLGCVFFQLLTGQVPFERDSDVSKIFAHINDAPPSLAAVSPQLGSFDQVIQRAMAKDPNQRFAAAGDLGRAAVGVAEMRAIELGERSVATGAAAPATGPGVDPDATRVDSPPTMPMPPQAPYPGAAAAYAGVAPPGPGTPLPPGGPGAPGGGPGGVPPAPPPAPGGYPTAPGGTPPYPPTAPAYTAPMAAGPGQQPPGGGGGPGRRAALIGGPIALVVIIGVVLVIILSSGGGGSPTPVNTTSSTSSSSTTPSTSSSSTSSPSSTTASSGAASGAWPNSEQTAYLQGCEKSGTEGPVFCDCTLKKLMAIYPASQAGSIDVNDPKVKKIINECLS